MIDPKWQLVDLDPYTWRAIGKYIDPAMYIRAGSPDEHALYLIHDAGRVLSVVEASGTRRNDLGISSFDDPRRTAGSLYETGEWDRVHVIDRRHLQKVSASAQQLQNRALELDAYYRNVFELVWGDEDGYVALPAHPRSWNGWTYQLLVEVVDQLQDPASLALGVVDDRDGSLVIGLIGEVVNGSFTKVTTFESLSFARNEISLSPEFFDRLWSSLSVTGHPPAAVLLCTSSVFDQWMTSPEKSRTIDDAIVDGRALLRTRDEPPLRW